ncbi:MAG TPA: AAA family ATPase [Verrucomicrobiae bacterium]|nr:AAA family ATPase [Verrucomicrobiae bacterium]
MAKGRPALQVEALTYSESIDGIVDKHFRGRPSHRAEDNAAYDINKIVEVHGARLLRSRQEYLPTASGLEAALQWASLCFELEPDVFVTILSKGNSYNRSTSEPEYKVTVVANTPQRAAEAMVAFKKEFSRRQDSDGPGFFIMTNGRELQRAPLEEKHKLDDATLDLLYGEEFGKWARSFTTGLDESGISILCGEPGTGKTSFLRHVMSVLSATHRFYFVPVDNFGILSSGNLTEFWKTEHRAYPSARKVLVLEDAETLLRDRESEHNAVSSILNLTDGLMTELVKVHLLATLNCKRDTLDKALMRPGRLRFFRDFGRIEAARAREIAARFGLTLPEDETGHGYTLAEIFASEKFEEKTAGAKKAKRPIGFGA